MQDANQNLNSQYTVKPKSLKKSKNTYLLLISIIVLLGIALGVSIYLLQKEKSRLIDPTTVASEEFVRIKEKIAKHMLLPDDKEAQLATVMDVKKLQEQNPEFYKNASNGDKLLIYPDRAILYNPLKDMIINVAPIINPEVKQNNETNEVEPTVESTPSMVVEQSTSN